MPPKTVVMKKFIVELTLPYGVLNVTISAPEHSSDYDIQRAAIKKVSDETKKLTTSNASIVS